MSSCLQNSVNGKQQLPFACCKRKAETANFCLFAKNGNGKREFIFLGHQTINGNGNQQLLFQQTCPSMLLGTGRH
jgi:hypothetical protein